MQREERATADQKAGWVHGTAQDIDPEDGRPLANNRKMSGVISAGERNHAA